MTVRMKIALTIFITGLLTAIAVIATVAVAFDRLERETKFERANAFLDRKSTRLNSSHRNTSRMPSSA